MRHADARPGAFGDALIVGGAADAGVGRAVADRLRWIGIAVRTRGAHALDARSVRPTHGSSAVARRAGCSVASARAVAGTARLSVADRLLRRTFAACRALWRHLGGVAIGQPAICRCACEGRRPFEYAAVPRRAVRVALAMPRPELALATACDETKGSEAGQHRSHIHQKLPDNATDAGPIRRLSPAGAETWR